MRTAHSMTRRQFIGACVGAVACIGAACIAWEDNRLVLSEHEVGSARLPRTFDGFRIAHISDYHNKAYPAGDPVIRLVGSIGPDLIAITGDLFDRNHTDLARGYALVEKCVKMAPTYFVPGNHENGLADRVGVFDCIAQLGAHVLIFHQEELWRGDASIRIAGVPDPVAPGHWSAGVAGAGPAALGDDRYTLLLSHRPERFDEYCDAGYDLVLAGHAHGGQVCLPGGRAILAPHQGFFPRYTSGLHQCAGTSMVISRGIGVSSFPVRVNCAPEVVCITLRSLA